MMLDSGKSAALSFDAASVSYQGARPYQEDSVLCSFPIGQPLGFAVIADGIGGHARVYWVHIDFGSLHGEPCVLDLSEKGIL